LQRGSAFRATRDGAAPAVHAYRPGLALAGVSLAGAAMCAAAGLMVVARTPPRRALAGIDWLLLVFFAGLFVIVAGIGRTGLLDRLFGGLAPMVARGDWIGDASFVALVVLASNAVSNVPLVIVAVGWVPRMPNPTWAYVMLAVASTLAGTSRCSAASPT
jgi:Na+/H+ antiporter NhaD/arsenite permease-like protein